MAAITNKRFTDTHPFTADSTLKLSNGLTIPTGSVISCNLYPVTSDNVAYGYISEIKHDGSVGILVISSANGANLCDVTFNLELGVDTLEGVATDVRGIYCGSMVVRSDWLPIFFGSYKLKSDSLKLNPSSCRLLVVPSNATINSGLAGVVELRYQATSISAIKGDGTTVKEDADGKIYVDTSNDPDKTRHISSFSVNGAVVEDNVVMIIATGGGTPITTGSGEIIIGEE